MVQLSFSLIGCVNLFCISVISNTFVNINILILNNSFLHLPSKHWNSQSHTDPLENTKFKDFNS